MDTLKHSFIACSHCFHDIGLRKETEKVGVKDDSACPVCGGTKGMKLDKEKLIEACTNYFHYGSYAKTTFGGANTLEFNEYKHDDDIQCFAPLKKDIKLLADKFNINVFYYGPQMWKVGFNNWLQNLQSKNSMKRKITIEKIASRCYKKVLGTGNRFYRIRKNLESDFILPETYDAPASLKLQKYADGRMNLRKKVVFYAAFNVETCIHESRVTIDDEIFVATLNPTRDLKFLDFCRIKKSKKEPTEFENLGTAIRQIFYAGASSYKITQAFSQYAYDQGYDGVIYPSYFNSVRDMTFRNIVIFGRPIAENKVKVRSIDRINLTKVKYDFTFGPVTE